MAVLNLHLFEYFEGFSEHGIFHGITDYQENKLLKINNKNGLLIIEWRLALTGNDWHWLASQLRLQDLAAER